jgi:hypothetical protein
MADTPTIVETRALISRLNAQRGHVMGILDGLSDEELRRAVLPSGWTALALIKHLTFDIEYFWFRGIVAGEPIRMNVTPDEMWIVAPEITSAEVFDAYRQEAAHSDEIISARSMDDPLAWWPDDLFPPEFRYDTVREVVLHVLAETATHAGHLDIVRELIDQRQWVVMT